MTHFGSHSTAVVSFRLILGFQITGLIGEKHTAANVEMAECPIELPLNSV